MRGNRKYLAYTWRRHLFSRHPELRRLATMLDILKEAGFYEVSICRWCLERYGEWRDRAGWEEGPAPGALVLLSARYNFAVVHIAWQAADLEVVEDPRNAYETFCWLVSPRKAGAGTALAYYPNLLEV